MERAQAGVTLTPAGAAFPGVDPEDSVIRIAPSYPPDGAGPGDGAFSVAVKLAAWKPGTICQIDRPRFARLTLEIFRGTCYNDLKVYAA